MREKLIELLDDFSTPIMLLDTKLMDWNIPTQQLREAFADYLVANDVVPVVRCRDCRKCSTYDDVITGQKQYICRLWHGATREVDEDSFCSVGERKDNEG